MLFNPLLKTTAQEIMKTNAKEIVYGLLGEPVKITGNSWRYNRRMSLCVDVEGDKAGFWYDFETGESGDLIELAKRQRGSFTDAAMRVIELKTTFLPNWLRESNDSITKQQTLKYAKKLWEEATEFTQWDYLNSRSIGYIPREFPIKTGTESGTPVIVPVYNSNREISGVHLTYIGQNQENHNQVLQRKMFGNVAGNFTWVQSMESNRPPLVAEGVETALSVAILFPERSVVVAFNRCNAMRVTAEQNWDLAADNDGITTQETLNSLKSRNPSYSGEVIMPETEGFDFNDVLQHVREKMR